MQILFTVSENGPERDLWVDADPCTPFGALAEALEPDGSRAWWDGERPLRMDAPLGEELIDGMVISHSPPPADRPHAARPVLDLLAVAGPHTGTVWPLTAGDHLVGRSDDAAVNLVRDLMVSRRHATISVRAGAGDRPEVSVRDEGSAHGTAVEGEAVDDAGQAADEGAYIRVGNTVLSWRRADRPAGPAVRNGAGGLVFNRPPRLLAPAGASTVRFPGPAPVQSGINFPLVASVAPVVLGVVLAVAVGQLLFLLFTVLTPVIGVSNYLSQRRSGVKSHRERVRSHQAATARATSELERALADETARRRSSAPDAATLAVVAETPLTSLWERRLADEDFMSLRVGLSDQPATVVVEGRDGSPHGTDQEPATVRLVPTVVDVRRDGVLGVAGERRLAESLAVGLLLQSAVLHAPEDLTVTVLTGPNQRHAWAWARWLPHLRDRDGRSVARIGSTDAGIARLATELSALIDDRLGRRATEAEWSPGHLVIVDGAYQLGALPGVTKILRSGPGAGVMSICIDDAEQLLPEECRAVAVFEDDTAAGLRLSTGRGLRTAQVLAELVDPRTAESVARRLAPLRLNRRTVSGAAIPSNVRLLDQLALDPPSPQAVLDGWAADGRSTAAVVGVCEGGPMVVDLARDGPHGLVAGTTGSGKSELLQTLIASLAVANRPDRMNFVLVDYKGGSAFKECARLPHTVGMVTDLDVHLTERALASIGAELRRREVVLAGAGAKDLEAYWRSAGPDGPTLGRLVIVIDEFASLVEELPEFVDGLVDLARRGRSLGLHLILATQRPSGVVSAAIKTNTNLRIAMRVTDAADSVDVIDSPLASRIAKSSPGRGYARVGHEELTEFQAARIGGRRRRSGGPRLRVEAVEWPRLGEALAPAEQLNPDEDTTDLALLVDAVNEAAGRGRTPTAPSPWLPPLPECLTLEPAALQPPASGEAPAPALFGLQDLPDQQAQRYADFDLVRDGHLLVVGDPGSGRSTLLRSLAAGLAARNSAADVHIYGLDCGNGALTPLERFPHVGAVVSRREPDRVDRLATKLLALTSERQQMLARRGFATIADQRRLSPPGDRLPYIVVLLDRWEGFSAEFETLDGGRLVNSLMHLMREGLGAGVRLVVTADRSGITARFSSLFERILMLRLNDRTVYSILGLNPRRLPDHIPPGRGFYARGGVEMQVGLLTEDPAGPAQVAAVERLAAEAARRDTGLAEERRPDPIAVLPLHAPLSALLEQTEDRPAGTAGPVALVGIGGDRLSPIEVDLGRHGPGFVISGPPRSGRSNALVAIGRSVIRRGGRVVGVSSRPSPLSLLSGQPGVVAVLHGPALDPAQVTDAVNRTGATGLTILVDDAEILADTPAGEVLAAFVKSARDFRAAVVVAGTAGELNQFRGFIPEARKSRTGLLLCPSPGDGELLGARLPRTAIFTGPPGRGVLVSNGESTVVQVPFDDLGG